MINVLGVCGTPLSGKSSLMIGFLDCLPGVYEGSWGPVRFLASAEAKVLVLGVYFQGETYGGVDRLPIDIGDKIQTFLRVLSSTPGWDGYTVYMEGERIFSEKFLDFLTSTPGLETRLIGLDIDDETRRGRALMRGDEMGSPYNKGRMARYYNMAKLRNITTLSCNTQVERAWIVERMIEGSFFKVGAGVPAAR